MIRPSTPSSGTNSIENSLKINQMTWKTTWCIFLKNLVFEKEIRFETRREMAYRDRQREKWWKVMVMVSVSVHSSRENDDIRW